MADLTADGMPVDGSMSGSNLDLPAEPSRTSLAVADLVEGWRQHWMWTRLAHQDMRLRYRGSVIGPFWQTLATAIMIGSMGVIYGGLFHTALRDYLPLLASGLILWQFIAGVITEGCGTFDAVRGLIQQTKLPFFLHALRLVYRNVLILAHSFVIVPVVLLIFPHPIEPAALLQIIPGAVLVLINGVAISMLLGMLCIRFRDVPQIVASMIQVIFFLTPIMWPPSALGSRQWLATINPLYAEIDVLRAPMLGQPVSPHSWEMLVAFTVMTCIVAFMFFARFRSRIAYWV